jgi:hypothetical protein
MILIFITNMGNSSEAFEFVKGATLPMMLGNAAAVGLAILIVSLLSRDRLVRKKSNEKISNTFQRWLLVCIVIAYLVTSSFTYILQNGMVKVETKEVYTTAIEDVEADINGKSNAHLLGIAEEVKAEYEKKADCIVGLSTIYRFLRRHNWRKIAPRPIHPKADKEAQESFKKTPGNHGIGRFRRAAL